MNALFLNAQSLLASLSRLILLEFTLSFSKVNVFMSV